MSTPLSNSNRRSSLTFSPKRSVSNEDQAGSSPNQTATNSVERKTSFVTKTTVFLEPERKRSNAGVSGSNPAGAAGHLNLEIPDLNSERVKFDSSSLPTSPTSEEISTTSSVGGGKVEKILKGSLDSIPSPSVKIQIMSGKVSLRCKGKTLLGGNCLAH